MQSKKGKFTYWLKHSITARMLVVGFLLMVLLVPLEFVSDLITERALRQEEVVKEINSKWGNELKRGRFTMDDLRYTNCYSGGIHDRGI